MQFKWFAKLVALGKQPWYVKRVGTWTRRGYLTHYNADDIKQVADMVVFLRKDKHDNAVGNRKGNIGDVYHYTCKHFDKTSGNCMNYENRPDMCRVYPNGYDCRYKGCTNSCATTCTKKKVTDGLSERCEEAT